MAAKHRYSPGKIGSIVDIIHIAICIVVCFMAAFAITNPDSYSFLFPLIFLLASGLSAVTGWYILVSFLRNTKRKAAGIVYFAIALVLFLLFMVSAISIWFHD